MKRDKILITGASGFVGTALLKSLDKRNIICLGKTFIPDVDFIYSDYSFSKSIANKFRCVKTIVHCAGRAHVMNDDRLESKKLYRHANVDTTANIAMMAKMAEVQRFIYLSSIKVNGNSNEKPFEPHDDPCPKDYYGLFKLEAEKKLIEICQQCSMDYAIIRPPLIYGPGAKGNLESLQKFLAKNMPNPFSLINENKRSMISIFNLISLIRCCCEFDDKINQTFLVSDNHDVSTSEIVNMISNSIGSRNIPLPVPTYAWKFLGVLFNKSDYVERLVGNLQVNIKKTTKFLNWVPELSVKDGFKKSFSKDV